ncbi:LacI family transcriptional regulator [bacterium]|nr:MAG: LacI family transcriptional regulator [bacterium]
MQTRVTIGDVAAKAGVSKVTVSYVLSGRGADARIKAETVARVSAIAKELGYQRNAVAAMLKAKRSHTIAIAFQYADLFGTGSDFTNEVMRGVCEAAQARGYDLMLHTRTAASPEEEVSAFTDGRVDGVLILRDEDDPTLRLLQTGPVPCVSFFCACGNAWVDADNVDGGRQAVRHLTELGHRRLLVLKGASASGSSNERVHGIVREAVVQELPDPVVLNAADKDGWKRLLRSPSRPTAVIAWSDDAAAELLAYASEIGLRCPEDLSVVGFDSLTIAERLGLTSVGQPVRQIAQTAFNLLVDMVDAADPTFRERRFPVRLDVRGTTGRPSS